MAKQMMVLMAGAASLFVGTMLAGTPAAMAADIDDPGYVNGGHFAGLEDSQKKEAPATATQKEAPVPEAKNMAVAETPAAPAAAADDPGYVNGGHFAGMQGK